MSKRQSIQYACAVLLILSSIALVFFHEMKYGDVANGVLLYIAQAFLLAASIFGLDIYVQTIRKIWKQEDNATITP